MTKRYFPLAGAMALGLVLAVASHADAQGRGAGNGRPKAPKTETAPSQTGGSTTSGSSSTSSGSSGSSTVSSASSRSVTPAPEVVPSLAGFRQFGSWVDDASAAFQGDGYLSIGVGYWRMPGMSQTNIPMVGAGIGVTDRIQASVSVPFYNVQYDGVTARGLDDVYVGAKYTLVDPALTISEFGIAVSPVMEVLSPGTPGGRVHFAIPVSMELRRAPYRVYGSAGYFTRGSVFTGGAVEWSTPTRLVLTGLLTQSYSIKADPLLDSLAVGRQRVDLMGSAAYPFGTMSAVYASVGRSLVSPPDSVTTIAVSGGLSIRFSR